LGCGDTCQTHGRLRQQNHKFKARFYPPKTKTMTIETKEKEKKKIRMLVVDEEPSQ
jgi:hypothetical protein